MSEQSKSKIFCYSAEIGEVILNSSPQTSDICLISGIDGRCFKSHRVVLAGASLVLAEILDTSCQFCGGEPEDNSVLTFADVSGNVLEHFLALCYTGVSLNFKSAVEESELRRFCSELKLGLPETLVRCPQSSFPATVSGFLVEPSIGFIECEKNFLPSEILKLDDVEGVAAVIPETNFEDFMAAGKFNRFN
jgi:hypothetical protein